MAKGDAELEKRIEAASEEAKEMRSKIKANLDAKADTTRKLVFQSYVLIN